MIFSMGKFCRIIFLFFVLIPTFSRSQTTECDDPEQTIALATEEFNAGHFYGVPAILNKCFKDFNRDQRQRAHLLLTQTYLLLDDPIGAQRSFLEVLTANPEFVPDEQLHAIDVVYLSKRFTATPKFSWFVGAGSNVSPVRMIMDLEPTDSNEKKYRLLPGYNFGGGGEYSFDDHLKVRIEANFFQTGYKLEVSKQFVGEREGDSRIFIDRQMWMNVPLYVCYSDNVGKYRPYGYVGVSISKPFADKAPITVENEEPVVQNEGEEQNNSTYSETSPVINFLDMRLKLNQSLIFGGGIKYKIGLDFVFAEVRYSAGLKNIVNPENSYGGQTIYPNGPDSPPLTVYNSSLLSYRHRDDYFRLDNIALTVGFLRPLYKPRELKRARTKSVLKKMSRGK